MNKLIIFSVLAAMVICVAPFLAVSDDYLITIALNPEWLQYADANHL